MPPHAATFALGDAGSGDLFAPEPERSTAALAEAARTPRPTVPKGFLALAQLLALHRDPARWTLLYRLLWRLVHEPALRHDPLDADLLRARRMAQSVRRDLHKMRAFVRFRQVIEAGEPEPLHVAWFEPEHRIVHAIAPWFARRFATMRWAILTPQASVRFTPANAALHHGPGAARADAPPPDAGEALWLTYYQHIFNPARLNLRMMQSQMPQRYWRNLPEAALIEPLARAAAGRTAAMVRSAALDAGKLLFFKEQTTQIQSARQPDFSQIGSPEHTPITEPTRAADAAAGCHALDDLAAAVQRCRACPIGACATQAVHGEGPVGAGLMLVGEQPGDQEDLQGRPFVGPAGQLLDQALVRAGLARPALFLTNAVRHFKHALRGKRRLHKTPGQREAMACTPWLRREIELVRPAALVAMGATAARAVLGRAVSVTAERGRWQRGPDGRPVLITWHPAALLRLPAAERADAERQWHADWALAAQGPPAV